MTREASDDVRAITGVPTSITAFVGRTRHGPTDRPVAIDSFPEFERVFGGLSSETPLSHSVRQFFANGGREALICRADGDGGGVSMLDQADLFNIVCIPPPAPGRDVEPATWAAAAGYARRRRAMLLVDPPSTWAKATDISPAALEEIIPDIEDRANAAIYFPAILAPDPEQGRRLRPFPPSGTVAGIYARTDATQGVWKAPAGRGATLVGVEGLAVDLTDRDNDLLNPRAVNCLRNFPRVGPIVWGARVMSGADGSAHEWKYVPMRRFAMYLEESLDRGTSWAVFEPNDEPLWLELRRRIETFLHELFQRGALRGQKPDEAYFVKCGRDTMTQADIEGGVVNILVGFAPLKPAEFVILRIRHAQR